MTESRVRVALVYPELLGTYGDRGNAVVLVERARRRGIEAEIVEIAAGTAIPIAVDVYVFGGGEDDAQVMAATGMRESAGAIERARAAGAVVFAVCAGFQLIGTTYTANDGDVLAGLGIVDLDTRPGDDRLIGECIVEPRADSGLPTLTGFENHGGRTTLGPGVAALGRVAAGHGNGIDGVDGVLGDRILGTYLHGPVLPRNPALADHLLAWIVGDAARTPLDDHLVERLRSERLRETRRTGWSARRRDWHLNRG